MARDRGEVRQISSARWPPADRCAQGHGQDRGDLPHLDRRRSLHLQQARQSARDDPRTQDDPEGGRTRCPGGPDRESAQCRCSKHRAEATAAGWHLPGGRRNPQGQAHRNQYIRRAQEDGAAAADRGRGADGRDEQVHDQLREIAARRDAAGATGRTRQAQTRRRV